MVLSLKLLPFDRSLHPTGLHPSRGVAPSRKYAHCGRFSAAASRRSMDRVSVPSSGVTLSGPLRVIALVSYYLTNKLIRPRPFPKHRSFTIYSYEYTDHLVLACVSAGYPRLWGKLPRLYWLVRHYPSLVSYETREGPFDLHALSTPPAFILS